MENIQNLLQVSARLYEFLTDIPSDEKRMEYINELNKLLDERGLIIASLQDGGFTFNVNQKNHQVLFELDKGIRDRLDKVMKSIQIDLKDLQNAKKHEQQYMNPYSSVQVMDGRYYDKKN